MTPTDIARVQTYLRRLLGSEKLKLVPPTRKGMSVEIAIDEEVIGTIHRDDEEGEVSFAVHITVLEEDLPPAPAAAAAPKRR
jgi:hypothetical protein